MQSSVLLWTVFFVLGMLLWLASIGIGTHPFYRLMLMFAIFTWFACVVRVPKGQS